MNTESLNESPLVVVVDDDPSIRESLSALLRSTGLRAEVFASAEDFLNSEALDRAACLILDVDMPGMTGPQLQGELNVRGSRVPIVFITGRPKAELRTRLLAAGARSFFGKPFDEDALLEEVDTAARPPERISRPTDSP